MGLNLIFLKYVMDTSLIPLLTSFFTIFLAELGDKTQICIIILSSRSSVTSVFLGAMGAFFIVDGLSAILGGGLLSLLPKNIIGIASGITFMMLGLISLTYGGKSKNQRRINGASLLKIFLLISLMELGDKTQVFSILLTAQFRNPLVVLTGIMSAFTIITAIGIFLGQKMLGLLPEKYLRKGTALVFTIFGLIQIVKVLLNINILF